MSEVLAAIVAWSMQATALVIATTTVLACARVRAPEVRLRAWQATALVAFAAALPSRGLLVRPQAVEALTVDVVSGPSHAAATLGPGAAGLVLATLGIVASVRLLILVAGWSRLRRSANRGTQPAAPLFDRTAEELGVTARLVVVDGAAPFTFGRRSPIVVVDRAVLADDRTARAVFLHELSHVARGDCTAVVVEAIASSVSGSTRPRGGSRASCAPPARRSWTGWLPASSAHAASTCRHSSPSPCAPLRARRPCPPSCIDVTWPGASARWHRRFT